MIHLIVALLARLSDLLLAAADLLYREDDFLPEEYVQARRQAFQDRLRHRAPAAAAAAPQPPPPAEDRPMCNGL